MPEICVIPTTVGRKPTKFISIEEANRWIEEHLNPKLKLCGTLPECRNCNIGAYAQMLTTVGNVAEKIRTEI